MLSLKNDLLYIIAQLVIMTSSKSHHSDQPPANGPSPIEQYPCGLNMLDEDLRNATTVKAFKKALKLVMNE